MANDIRAANVLERLIMSSTVCLVAGLAHSAAFAQRGQNNLYSPERSREAESASSHVPGFFDTELAREGEFIAEFPTLTMDYGISERWTLGTNALSTLFGISALLQTKGAGATPAFSLKSRHALFADSGWKGTATGYFHGINNLVPTGSQKTLRRNRFLAGSLNITKQTGRNLFGLSSAVLHQVSNRGDLGSLEQEHERTVALFITPLWKFKISDNFDSFTTATFCPAGKMISSNPGIRKDSTSGCLGESSTNAVWRILVNWRSSQSWLWTVGALSAPMAPEQIFPYLGFNSIWSPRESVSPEDNTESSE
jgi:hypothetical protein